MSTSSLASTETLGHAPTETARARRERELRSLKRLGHRLDSAFRIPGTDKRIGWDGIIGLVPGVGDLTGAALSAYLVVRALRMGAPRRVLTRMVGNIAIDALVGTVPLVGDVFDVMFKANEKNMALLERWLEKEAARP